MRINITGRFGLKCCLTFQSRPFTGLKSSPGNWLQCFTPTIHIHCRSLLIRNWNFWLLLDETLARNGLRQVSALIYGPCVIGFRTVMCDRLRFLLKEFHIWHDAGDTTKSASIVSTTPCDELRISAWVRVSAMSAPGLRTSSSTAVNRAAPRACGVSAAPHPTHPLGHQIETPAAVKRRVFWQIRFFRRRMAS